MDENQRNKLEDRIRKRLAEITALDAASAEDRAVVTLDQQSVGRLSRMDAMQQQAMAKETQRRRATEIARLKNALRMLDEGEYGWCQSCGEAIAPARLEIDLAATLCVSCASGG